MDRRSRLAGPERPSCITVHVDAALKHGAIREEIAEALGVAVTLNAGTASVFSARVMDAVDAHR